MNMAKMIGIGVIVIGLGWAGWTMLGDRSAGDDAMLRPDNAMATPSGEAMMKETATGDDAMMDTATDTMMQSPDSTR